MDTLIILPVNTYLSCDKIPGTDTYEAGKSFENCTLSWDGGQLSAFSPFSFSNTSVQDTFT